MLGQSQACLWLRTGLGKIKTVGDILAVCCGAESKPSGKALGAWMTTGWSEVPPSAVVGKGWWDGAHLNTLADRCWVASSSLSSLVERAGGKLAALWPDWSYALISLPGKEVGESYPGWGSWEAGRGKHGVHGRLGGEHGVHGRLG